MSYLCFICSNRSSFFMRKDGYNLYLCARCGLVFVFPQPNKKYLAEQFYSPKSGYQKYKTKNLSKTKEGKKEKKIFKYLQQRLDTKRRQGQILLDVGCSSGEFLYHARKRGFVTHGIELNKTTALIARANGLRVSHGTLENSNFEDNFFDIIFLGDVLEHVLNPRSLLIECKRILKDCGVVIIVTPNSDCFWSKTTLVLYKVFSIPWSTAEPPGHLYQFSHDNLYKLLADIDFAHDREWFHRPPPLTYELGSLHLLKRFKKKKSIFNFLFMIFSFSLYALLYILDIVITPIKRKDCAMVVCCVKNDTKIKNVSKKPEQT